MHNPYTPPTANLNRVMAPISMPSEIVLAMRILWITLAIGTVSTIPGFRVGYWDETGGLPIGVMIGMLVFFTLLFAAFVIYIARGRNWARWLMLIFIGVGWLFMAFDPSSLISQGQLAVIVDLATAFAEAYALKLLFIGKGSAWFKAERW